MRTFKEGLLVLDIYFSTLCCCAGGEQNQNWSLFWVTRKLTLIYHFLRFTSRSIVYHRKFAFCVWRKWLFSTTTAAPAPAAAVSSFIFNSCLLRLLITFWLLDNYIFFLLASATRYHRKLDGKIEMSRHYVHRLHQHNNANGGRRLYSVSNLPCA